jgi:hypothetical protein
MQRALASCLAICSFVLPSLAVSADLAAQAVHVVGKVVPTANGFGLASTTVQLQSSTIPLNTLTSQVSDLRGTVVPGTFPPVIDVTAATRSAAVFQLGGNARLGRNLQLRVDDPSSLWWYAFFSTAEGFMPLTGIVQQLDGTLLIDYSYTATYNAGALTNGTWSGLLLVPNDPQLIGLPIRFQFATITANLSALYINVCAAVISA